MLRRPALSAPRAPPSESVNDGVIFPKLFPVPEGETEEKRKRGEWDRCKKQKTDGAHDWAA